MSSFGIKAPLRKAIVTQDFYWSTSEELVQFFNANNEKENRVYKEITEYDINFQKLPNKKALKGNTKEHMIVFRKDGAIVRKHDIYDCEFCLVGDIENCVYESGNYSSNKVAIDVDEEDGHDDDDDDDDDDDNENNETVLHAIVHGNIITLRTPRESKESFYLCVVNKIEEATAQIFDVYQHIVLPGTLYLSCNYITIHSEKSIRYIQYKKLSGEKFSYMLKKFYVRLWKCQMILGYH